MLVSPANIEAATNRIARADALCVDLETTGLRPYLGDRLIGLAVEAAGEAYYFPFRHAVGANLESRHLLPLLETITDGHATLGGHNFIRFDCQMMGVESDLIFRQLLQDDRVKKWDTIIDALLANENEPSFSLDALGQKYLGASAEKHARKAALIGLLKQRHPGLRAERQLMGHMADLTPAEVAPYACGDVLDTAALRRVYQPHLEQWGLGTLADEMYCYARLLAKIQRRGLLVDADECRQRVVACTDQQVRALQTLRGRAGPLFNPNSWQQVMALCGTQDAEAETLRRSGHPLAGQIVEYKQLGKMRSTYYQGILDRLDADGIIHPQMNLTRDPRDVGGTRSGRLSCSDPNFQNIPKRSPKWYMRVRDVVRARPGHVLMPFDYERAEMWLGAHYSGDEALDEAYHQGRDLYTEMAEAAGCDRQQGKITWLAIQYGAGAAKIAEMFDWPFITIDQFVRRFEKEPPEWQDHHWRAYMDQRAVRTRSAFFDLCPGIKWMMKALADRARQDGSLRLWTGRVVHFDGVKTRPFAAWNRLIQGGVGEMMRLAMQRLEEPLDDIGASMLLQVHDEIVVEVPVGNERAARDVVCAQMEGFDFRLKPRIGTMIGESYGHVEEYRA